MRDFSPVEMACRNYIFNTIRTVYELYGYRQIETPTMEMLSTLMGKYGEEGDRLLFKVLDSGDVLSKFNDEELAEKNSIRFAAKACEKGLRYDLTVPLARYVVMNRNDISFPFKRFQIQPVWRADRPQRGRYREFYQCDADVIGSDSLFNEVELIAVINEVFKRLGIRTSILLNNRKVLSGMAEVLGERDRIIDITVAIDKLDKIGLDKVMAELEQKGFGKESLKKLEELISVSGSNREQLEQLKVLLASSEEGLKGIEELSFILDRVETLDLSAELKIDFSLARGLSYYTGAILEVKALDVAIGSISGGGRYDNLTGIFGLDGMSGVGISFGADRIYDVLMELDLFPKDDLSASKLLFINFGEAEATALLPLLQKLRSQGLGCELYPDSAKIKKQMSFANALDHLFVVLVGAEELKQGIVNIKDMHTGEQQSVKADAESIIACISSLSKKQ